MIRFIECNGMYHPKDSGQFGFYNTINDRFITIYDDQLFETVEELKIAMDDAKYSDEDRDRLLSLIPDNWK